MLLENYTPNLHYNDIFRKFFGPIFDISKLFKEKFSITYLKFMIKHIFKNISFFKICIEIYENSMATKLSTIKSFLAYSLNQFFILENFLRKFF